MQYGIRRSPPYLPGCASLFVNQIPLPQNLFLLSRKVKEDSRDLIAPLFFNDRVDLDNLIRKRHILRYVTGSFHPSLIDEYGSGLLMALQKQDGGIRPLHKQDVSEILSHNT